MSGIAFAVSPAWLCQESQKNHISASRGWGGIGRLVACWSTLIWVNAVNQAFVPVAFQRESCLIFLGHMETRTLHCAVICNIWVQGCVHVFVQEKWWNWTFTLESDEENAMLSLESISTHMPPWPYVVMTYRGRVGERGEEIHILHNPKERRDLDVTANWQCSLQSRLDLPLPLKFIFQLLGFGQFHQMLRRACDKRAGLRFSCIKILHQKTKMLNF